IIINNIVTAGFAVVIVALHYITVYDPTRDAFQKDGQTPTSFRPNPVDKVSLTVYPILLFPRPSLENGTSKKFANFLIKCIRAMSDIQIVTGFSIMISGFVQLKCGLATYHWLVIVHLAWLSCLTQLSCLTLLRNHLHDHPTERTIRLLVVGALVILLIVGLSFTGNYHWAFNADNIYHPTLSDPAICHMRARPGKNSAFFSMSHSMILIVYVFASRVISLYDTLSVGVIGRARIFLSGHIRKLLRIVYNWSHASRSPRSLKLTLCYLPLLSVYLTCLVLVDMWDSAITEVRYCISDVAWLIIAFAFGIARVIGTIYRPEKMGLEASLTGFNDWSFGQVAAVVLLAAPLITIIEYFKEGSTEMSNTRVEDDTHTQDEELPVSGDQTTTDPNDPDNDWISHPKIPDLIFRPSFMFTFMIIFWMADHDSFGKTSKILSDGVLISTGLGTPLFILCSLMVDTIFAERTPEFHANIKVLVEIYSIATQLVQIFSFFATITYFLLPILIIGALAARYLS
ncbi:hypothetical protein N7494_007876, partial [Penicillium frequentans]